jgi:hypothetical protein
VPHVASAWSEAQRAKPAFCAATTRFDVAMLHFHFLRTDVGSFPIVELVEHG